MDLVSTGAERSVRLQFRGLRQDSGVHVTRIDDEHGSSLTAYRAMGSPAYPTGDQVVTLNRAAQLPAAQLRSVSKDGSLTVAIPVNGLILVEVARKHE